MWVHAAKRPPGTGSHQHLHSQGFTGASSELAPSPGPAHLPGVEPHGSVSPASSSGPRSSGAGWWEQGQLAGGAVQRETLGRGLRLLGKRQQQSHRKNPLISILRALHFFSRKVPTFSSESKYHALILCVNRLASPATDDCSFGKFIVAINGASLSLSSLSLSLLLIDKEAQ